MSVAYKEWNLVCEALGAGRQHLLLRKGGIHEGTEGFSFKHQEFYLFPTFFHGQVAKTRLPSSTPLVSPPPGEIHIKYFSKIVWSAHIKNWEIVRALAPYHIWTEELIRQRFNQDDRGSLHAAIVRVYQLEPIWTLADSPSFGGCRSWLKLPSAPSHQFHAVCSDEEHQRISKEIQQICGHQSQN